MAAGNGSVGCKLEYRIPAIQRGAAVTWALEHQFCLISVEFQSVRGHLVADIQDTALKLVNGWRDFVATKVEIPLCVISISMKRYVVLSNPVRKIRHVQNEKRRTKDWALRNRATDADDERHHIAIHNAECPAWQIWTDPREHSATQAELTLGSLQEQVMLHSIEGSW